MRLDTACFVAPKPKVPSMPTRRAFLLAGSTFVVGACVGGAAVHAMHAPAVDEAMTPTGNAELDELRRLAVRAPIDELYANHQNFLAVAMNGYRGDRVVWRGIGRLVDHVIAHPDLSGRRVASLLLRQSISVEPELQQQLAEKLPTLQSIR